MENRILKQLECYDMGDKLYPKCISDFRNLKANKENISRRDYEIAATFLSSQMGLACEYYLKGLILPYIKISSLDEDETLKKVAENLTEDEKYRLLIGDENISKELLQKYKISKGQIKKMKSQALTTLGHNISNIINLFEFDSDNDIPEEIKKQLFKNIKSYFFLKFGLSELDNTTINQMMEMIDKPNISNTFVKGRYGHMDDFVPDNENLIRLMHAIRRTACKSIEAITLTTGNKTDGKDNSTSMRMVKPDEGSKIYVFDSGDTISRVYVYKKYTDFLNEINKEARAKIWRKEVEENFGKDKGIDDLFEKRRKEAEENFEKDKKYIDELYENFSMGGDIKEPLECCPEYGKDKMIEIANKHEELFEISLPKDYISLDAKSNASVAIQSEGNTQTYSLYNGELLRNGKEKTKVLEGLVQEYEKNIDNPEILRERKKIKKMYVDENEMRKERLSASKMIMQYSVNEYRIMAGQIPKMRPTFKEMEKRARKEYFFEAMDYNLQIAKEFLENVKDYFRGD